MASVFTAIGLMSGTSLDGVDAALIRTDGHHFIEAGPSLTLPYDEATRSIIRAAFGKKSGYAEAETIITDFHSRAVRTLLSCNAIPPETVNLIGFHGQTILHAPHEHFTLQIGDSQRLANETGVHVICDFRSNDVAHGGHGAPLVPLFHQALAHNLPKPLAILNIGGVANVTWLGRSDEILAFDTGPGNALIDDAMARLMGRPMDQDGTIARTGKIFDFLVQDFLSHDFFSKAPPKSLDRDEFKILLGTIKNLPDTDQIATLTALTTTTIAQSLHHMPETPKRWLVTGGGRHNATLMTSLAELLDTPVEKVETVNWCGDALEAQAFAYLAVRSFLKLPLTLPETTGAPKPLSGGRFIHQC